PAQPAPAAVAPPPVVAQADHATEVRSFTRVAEITRKLYQQGTANAVLTTAVREIGSHWETARCFAAMGKRGLPATAVEECCAEGNKKGSASAIAEVLACLQQAMQGQDPLAIQDAAKAPQLQTAKKALADLGGASVLAVPLTDGDETVGLLVLLHNRPRTW